jgi:hypothetical protein
MDYWSVLPLCHARSGVPIYFTACSQLDRHIPCAVVTSRHTYRPELPVRGARSASAPPRVKEHGVTVVCYVRGVAVLHSPQTPTTPLSFGSAITRENFPFAPSPRIRCSVGEQTPPKCFLNTLLPASHPFHDHKTASRVGALPDGARVRGIENHVARLAQVVLGLEGERKRIQNQLERVTNALSALNGLGTKGSKAPVAPQRRTMSASARARIAAAQRARWTKWKKAKRK